MPHHSYPNDDWPYRYGGGYTNILDAVGEMEKLESRYGDKYELTVLTESDARERITYAIMFRNRRAKKEAIKPEDVREWSESFTVE